MQVKLYVLLTSGLKIRAFWNIASCSLVVGVISQKALIAILTAVRT
jgi:hypothetical protein